MALKEGRCPNCGSILHLDPTAEKGHCLFCDAVFENKTAFEIAANPAGVVFPNLPQPKYEGPSLDPKSINASGLPSMKAKTQQPAKKAKPAVPAYVPKEDIKLPDMKLSARTKLMAFAIAVIVIGIIAAISMPIVMNRDNNRAKLLDNMSAVAPFAVDVDKDVSISRLSSSHLMIAADSAVSQDDFVTLYKNYCAKRAEVLGLDLADFDQAYGAVTVKLVSPQGGYIIEEPADQAAIDNGTAIIKLS